VNRLLKSCLKDFSEDFGLEHDSESKQFEKFCNYCIALDYAQKIDVNQITNGDDDAGIDGLFFIFDEEILSTVEEVEKLFEISNKKNISAKVIFVQSKTSSEFKKVHITNFSTGIFDFLSEGDAQLPQSDLLLESQKILEVILSNPRKIKGGLPEIICYYCTTGVFGNEDELVAAARISEQQIKTTEFKEVCFYFLGRSEILGRWKTSIQPLEADLEIDAYIPIPQIDGVEESYLALVSAQKFVKQVLLTEEGKIKSRIFDMNVRSFLGEQNDINEEIRNTLASEEGKERFVLMNNGITIVASDIKAQGKKVALTNYQIVNGCQTSHILATNFDLLDQKVFLSVKLIEANQLDVVSKIVQATNKQTPIKDEQFFGFGNKAESIESYFNAQNKNVNSDSTIYFERRENQFFNQVDADGKNIRGTKIFSVREVSRAFAAMFLERPDLASSYPGQLFERNDQIELFKDTQYEETYYVATLALYKFHSLLNGKKIHGEFRKYKYHILMIFKYIACWDFSKKGLSFPSPSDKKVRAYSEKMIDLLVSGKKTVGGEKTKVQDLFEICVEVVKEAGTVEKKDFKKQQYIADIRAAIRKYIAQNGRED